MRARSTRNIVRVKTEIRCESSYEKQSNVTSAHKSSEMLARVLVFVFVFFVSNEKERKKERKVDLLQL
jgi:hypothetical protein